MLMGPILGAFPGGLGGLVGKLLARTRVPIDWPRVAAAPLAFCALALVVFVAEVTLKIW
jgi:hypothetical protein